MAGRIYSESFTVGVGTKTSSDDGKTGDSSTPTPKGTPGWVIPNWAIGPSGPYGESGPFARPS